MINSSILTTNMNKITNCAFCNEIKYGLNIDNKIYNSLQNCFGNSRILYKTSKWNLLPSLGSFLEGYLLAVLKTHNNSLYYCTSAEKKELNDLSVLIEHIFLKKYNKNLIFFEHGNVIGNNSSNSINHTHIHFIPLNKSIWEYINTKYKLVYYEINNIVDINSIIEKYKICDYMLFRDINRKIYLIDSTNNSYPSQFFRIVLCDFFKYENSIWDWHTNYFIDTMYETFIDLNEYFCTQS